MWNQTKLERAERIVVSKRVVLEEGMVTAAIVITPEGKISNILKGSDVKDLPKNEKVLDFGDLVVLPGLVDSHVHVNEPGRTEWEGFYTATQAAAAGGVTTIVDMPLNSIPPTTTVANLDKKLKAAEGKLHVDVAFWGGLIPSNADDLLPLVNMGVVGFKCFLCPSGVSEFPHVSEADVRKALFTLKEADSVLAFHAELEQPLEECSSTGKTGDCSEYTTFLETRPSKMETTAVDLVCRLSAEYKAVRCHIVHASASSVVEQAQQARDEGAQLTVETCHHYLTLNAEAVPRGATMFKCCPPIRGKANQEELWRLVQKGDISLIVSDHSPCPPAMKGDCDFLSAWGGISSLQFGLTVLWTAAASRGVSLETLSHLTSSGPAELCRLPHKGSLAVGKDADLVVFDPDADVLLGPEDVLHRHKLSPHLGRALRGRVLLTMLRGNVIFRAGEAMLKPLGRTILLKK